MCKRKLNSKLKGENSNGFIDPNNNFDITNFNRTKFGNSKSAKLLQFQQFQQFQQKENKNLVFYIDDVVVCCESETLK